MLKYMKGAYRAWIDYPLREGKRIAGKYRIDRFLGEGSYGLTYLCSDLSSGRIVVIKQHKPSKGRLAVELLQREAAILGKLNHPDIPRLIETLSHRGRLFLVIEYVPGDTVEQLVFEQGAVFSERESLRFIRRLVVTASFIHDQGYVHLDIRLPNVIVRGDRLHLIDFGLAARIGEPARLEPDAGDDEEAIRRRTAEPSSDLYAIGHFLLFLLYSAYSPTPESRMSGEWAGSPPGWEQELAIAPKTRRIVRKLLQLDAPFRDASELLGELDAAVQALQV